MSDGLLRAIIGGAAIGAVFTAVLFLFNRICFYFMRDFLKPWDKFDLDKLKLIVKCFAQDSSRVKVEINHPMFLAENTLLGMSPSLGKYDPSSSTISIDTRFIRSRRALINTLLHEICHHNQAMQGRVFLGRRLPYHKQPIEQEANSFASAWMKKATEIYRRGLSVEYYEKIIGLVNILIERTKEEFKPQEKQDNETNV